MYHCVSIGHILGSISAASVPCSLSGSLSSCVEQRGAGRETNQPNHRAKAYKGTPITNRAVPKATTSFTQYNGNWIASLLPNTNTIRSVASWYEQHRSRSSSQVSPSRLIQRQNSPTTGHLIRTDTRKTEPYAADT